MTNPYLQGELINGGKMYDRVESRLDALEADITWVACGAGNPSVTGTALVGRVGKQVYGDLSLSCANGWPNSQVTAFILPDLSYAPGGSHPHRMNMGAPFQATAGSIILLATNAALAVYAGANGGAGNSQIYWYGPLWLAA